MIGIAHAEQPRVDVPIGDSPSLGPANAPVTIVEFIDFQ
jgi:protein-disulfide isomerase